MTTHDTQPPLRDRMVRRLSRLEKERALTKAFDSGELLATAMKRAKMRGAVA